MSKDIKLKKGLDIRLKGKAEKIFVKTEIADTYAIKPIDFVGVTPKCMVKVDDEVLAGSPLFYHKDIPEVHFTSPVSGKVVAINRGERRRILEFVIKADREIKYENFEQADLDSLSKEGVTEVMLKSGVWPFVRQRPYGIIANPKDEPKAIFISCFDKAPLAPDYDFVLKGEETSFQKGVEALTKLTSGKVHLNVNADYSVAKTYANARGTQINKVSGPHPSGNVGVQIHHIDPVNKDDVVWTVNPQDVVIIGRLFEKGVFDASRIVALTGSEIKKPRYYRTMLGAQITELIVNNIEEGDMRYISGNVLTGSKIYRNGHIGFYDSQLTVIPEGKYFEFMGWAMPGFKKYSAYRAFFSWMMPDKKYRLDTNTHGGQRAFVMTGKYEQVTPMDILPQHLMKSIMIEDIDMMENLGIYELVEEDLALCEYVCPSKIEFQAELRKGIDLMIKELS